MKQEAGPFFEHFFSTSAGINRLSLARFFLFGPAMSVFGGGVRCSSGRPWAGVLGGGAASWASG